MNNMCKNRMKKLKNKLINFNNWNFNLQNLQIKYIFNMFKGQEDKLTWDKVDNIMARY